MNVNVLIIEDDFKIAHIHKEMVEQLPFCHVLHTSLHAKDAMEFLETSLILPDIILLDMYIPDVQGLELVENLRKQYPYCNIIIASAANDTKTIKAAKQLGVFDFMIKPIDKERLQASFRNFKKEVDLQEQEWTQAQLDILFHAEKLDEENQTKKQGELPKGIDELTLEKILTFLPSLEEEYITAQLLTEKIGVSRSTARRYLEYLDAIQVVEATVHYGQVGRPQRMYILREQYEQN